MKVPPVRLVVQSMSFRNHNLPSLLTRAWWYRDSKRTNLNPCMRTKVQGPASKNRPWPTGAEANTSADGSLDFHTRQLDRFLSSCPKYDPWRDMNAGSSQEGPISVIGKPKRSRSSSHSSLLAEHATWAMRSNISVLQKLGSDGMTRVLSKERTLCTAWGYITYRPKEVGLA